MVGLWEAQRTLERGDFIEVHTLNLLLLLISLLPSSSPDPQAVLTVHPPRATIQSTLGKSINRNSREQSYIK